MSSDDLAQIVEPFFTVRDVIVSPIATLSLMFLVYGIYTVVFGLCTHVLYRRKRSGSGIYLICTISLFVLATFYVVPSAVGLARQSAIVFTAAKTREYEPLLAYLEQDAGATAWVSITDITGDLMNALADLMLIHRCYIVWGSNKVLLYTFIVGAFVLNGIGLAISILASLGLGRPSLYNLYLTAKTMNIGWSITNAVFNGLLSLLTGGRIWWISREARRHMGTSIHAKYKAIVAAVLESGALYPIFLIVAMVISVVLDPDSHGTVPVDLSVISVLLSGLAPTLIIVRVAYGKSVESVQQMVSIQFAERDLHQGPGAGTLRGTLDIHSRPRHGALELTNLEAAISEEKTSGDRVC
ncbi:hypothetical protein PQX77_013203 [Marasmius sp. AFHP31]|nr:hypothetical protein PQX77_013203 [Marasmius sp. AFHP31]